MEVTEGAEGTDLTPLNTQEERRNGVTSGYTGATEERRNAVYFGNPGETKKGITCGPAQPTTRRPSETRRPHGPCSKASSAAKPPRELSAPSNSQSRDDGLIQMPRMSRFPSGDRQREIHGFGANRRVVASL